MSEIANDESSLVQALRLLMEMGGHNQKSLAMAAQLNDTAIRDILQGRSKNPRRDTLKKIARALAVPVGVLTGDVPLASLGFSAGEGHGKSGGSGAGFGGGGIRDVGGFGGASGGVAWSDSIGAALSGHVFTGVGGNGVVGGEGGSGSGSGGFADTQNEGLYGRGGYNAAGHAAIADMPVYASARGGDGEAIFDYQPIEYIARPGPLSGVPNGFAMYVVGESMEPAYTPGDMLLVHPNRPPCRGDDVLIVVEKEGEACLAMVKQLVSLGSDEVVLAQHNPAKEFSIRREFVRNIFLIVGSYKGGGIR